MATIMSTVNKNKKKVLIDSIIAINFFIGRKMDWEGYGIYLRMIRPLVVWVQHFTDKHFTDDPFHRFPFHRRKISPTENFNDGKFHRQ
jgi:hypothetical protein